MIDCQGCNAPCCKNVAKLIDCVEKSDLPDSVKNEYRTFRHKINKDGSCAMLKDGRCSIYEHRPTMCNSEAFHNKHIAFMSYENFKEKLDMNCKALRK